jgi:hypothetical protein
MAAKLEGVESVFEDAAAISTPIGLITVCSRGHPARSTDVRRAGQHAGTRIGTAH